jgi:hypothetical protein
MGARHAWSRTSTRRWGFVCYEPGRQTRRLSGAHVTFPLSESSQCKLNTESQSLRPPKQFSGYTRMSKTGTRGTRTRSKPFLKAHFASVAAAESRPLRA